MDLIIFSEGMYALVPVTREMLEGISIPKGVDCFDLCEIIRENLTTYISSENKYLINGKDLFYGCWCGAEAPQ
jgi:hypothetical protein|tara:strand:+ start:1001 stop:1219 length:219 start_codon:yes stop_codon:yes gene_type:complete